MPKLTVYNIAGKETGAIELPAGFDKKPNADVIHQAVVMYQANARQGTLDTKIRSEISGGNKKPFRQKGTGQARQGSTRSPLFRHGGVVFGPHQRDFGFDVPRKVRIAALREALNVRYQEKAICCIDDLVVASGKTRDFVALLKKFELGRKKIVALFDDCSRETVLSSRNVPNVFIIKASEVNALDLIKNNRILATKASIEKVLKRLQ